MKKLSLFIFIFIGLYLKLSAEKFYIENYSVHIDIYQDGYFDVLEVIEVNFTQKSRGIIRSIPFKHKLSDGRELNIKLENIDVDDDPFKSYKEKGRQKIRIGEKGSYFKGLHTYSIRYRVFGAFSEFETHDEFYWNLIGDDWEVPINLVKFTIDVPQNYEMEGEFYGVKIADRDADQLGAEIWKSNERISGKTSESLAPKEGITVGLKFPKGYLNLDSINPIESQKSKGKSPWRDYAFPIPVLLFGLFFWYWKKHGSNGKQMIQEEAVFYPPENILPPEIGTFIDFVVHDHDVISLIPFWAQKGYLSIESLDEDELKITQIKNLDPTSLSYEKMLFNRIFGDSEEVFLSEIKNQLYDEIGEIKEEIKGKVNHRSLYDEEAIKKFHSGNMIKAFFISLILGIILIGFFQFFVTGAIMVLCSFILLILHFAQPKLSAQGLELKQRISQFQKTLKNPNQKALGKILAKDSQYFEKIYPYAIVFGLDDEFTDRFDTLLEQSPSWYVGGTQTQNFSHFKNNFDIQQVQQAFVVHPTQSTASNSGGSFTSGGSAGGGFGGGGGSSW